MAHFAELSSDNIVMRVVVVHNDDCKDDRGNESEQKGIDFCKSLFEGNWIQTSYNSTLRKNFAGIGFTYDAQRDAFIPPQTFASWTLNESTCQWEPPIPYPNDGKRYQWNEPTASWIEITEQPA